MLGTWAGNPSGRRDSFHQEVEGRGQLGEGKACPSERRLFLVSQEAELWGVPESMVETEDGRENSWVEKKPRALQGTQEMRGEGRKGRLHFLKKWS